MKQFEPRKNYLNLNLNQIVDRLKPASNANAKLRWFGDQGASL